MAISRASIYSYKKLISPKTDIRLLSVEGNDTRDTSFENVQFSLESYSLEEVPEYAAVSYVWGDVKADQSITIDGQSYLVRQNLASFLQTIAQSCPGKKFWIDALCIDQDDNSEKSAQVAVMHKIYERASEVLIWLGTSTALSRHAFESLQKIYNAAFPQGLKITAETFDVEANKPGKIQHFLDDHTREALSDLVANTWFERVWVLQECFFTQRAFLCSGELKLPWTIFWAASIAMLDETNYSSSSWPDTIDGLEQQITYLPFIMTYSRRVMYVLRETWQHQQTGPIKRTASLFTMLSGLFAAETGSHTSTDPRDRVYALLNMATDRDKLDLVPDYSKPCSQTYEDLCTAYLKQGYHNILCYSNGRRSELSVPSWAIDWTKPLPQTLRPNLLTVSIPLATFQFCAGTGPNTQTQSQIPPTYLPRSIRRGVLSCRSHAVDIIRLSSYVLGKIELSSCKAFVESLEPLAQWMASVLVRGRIYGHECSDRGKIEAGYLTSIAGQTCVDSVTEKADMRYCQEFVDALQLYRDIKDSRVTELPDWVGESEYLASLRDHKALFITETGLCGLGPRDVKRGDGVRVIVGCDMPMVLRKSEDVSGSFVLIGECYVHGLMNGQALKRSLDVEDIEIV